MKQSALCHCHYAIESIRPCHSLEVVSRGQQVKALGLRTWGVLELGFAVESEAVSGAKLPQTKFRWLSTGLPELERVWF